jgi:hypothetical protein
VQKFTWVKIVWTCPALSLDLIFVLKTRWKEESILSHRLGKVTNNIKICKHIVNYKLQHDAFPFVSSLHVYQLQKKSLFNLSCHYSFCTGECLKPCLIASDGQCCSHHHSVLMSWSGNFPPLYHALLCYLTTRSQKGKWCKRDSPVSHNLNIKLHYNIHFCIPSRMNF